MQAFAVGHRVNGVAGDAEPRSPREREHRRSPARSRRSGTGRARTRSCSPAARSIRWRPARSSPIATTWTSAASPSCCGSAGYRTVAMHANWPNFWNRDRMYPAMGYDAVPQHPRLRPDPRHRAGPLRRALRRAGRGADRGAAGAVLRAPDHALEPRAVRRPEASHERCRSGALAGTYVGDYLELGPVHGRRARRLRRSPARERRARSIRARRLRRSRRRRADCAGDRAARAARGSAPTCGSCTSSGCRSSCGSRADELRSVRHDPAGQVDIAPTIADLLGAAARPDVLPRTQPRLRPAASGRCCRRARPSRGARLPRQRGALGAPGCVDAATGAPVARERCDALAEHAARELAISRAEVNQDLFRWMPSPVANAGPGVEASRERRLP